MQEVVGSSPIGSTSVTRRRAHPLLLGVGRVTNGADFHLNAFKARYAVACSVQASFNDATPEITDCTCKPGNPR